MLLAATDEFCNCFWLLKDDSFLADSASFSVLRFFHVFSYFPLLLTIFLTFFLSFSFFLCLTGGGLISKIQQHRFASQVVNYARMSLNPAQFLRPASLSASLPLSLQPSPLPRPQRVYPAGLCPSACVFLRRSPSHCLRPLTYRFCFSVVVGACHRVKPPPPQSVVGRRSSPIGLRPSVRPSVGRAGGR